MKNFSYIPELDGLRTVAVLPVIFYHLGFTWIPGGFLGVDVFFVISGYLITAILIREVQKTRKLYFYDFYLRRLRRIFPAFFTVVLATLIVSYFILLPPEYLELGRSAAASVGFVSNIYFYLNTGYFDLPAESMALLHTWSLAVEEQFYLIWPAFILILSQVTKKNSLRLVVGIFLCSFFLSLFLTPIYPSLAFYNLPFRIFQFLLGAFIPLFLINTALYKNQPTILSASLQLLGLLTVVFSVLHFSSADGFPGWLAIVPSIGASTFIVGATMLNRPTINPMRSKLVVGIGKISFSLYLWHWPVVTLFKVYSNNSEITVESALLLLVIIFLLSISSYFLIEKPFRRPQWQIKASVFSTITAACVVMVFFLITRTGGLTQRIPDAANFASPVVMWNWNCPSKITTSGNTKKLCNFGVPWKKATKKIVLWGDSHAEQLAPLLELVALEENLSFVLFPTCRPLTDGKSILIRHPNPKRATKGCYEATLQVLDFIRRDTHIELVIIAGSWRNSPGLMFSNHVNKPSIEEGLKLMNAGLTNTVENVLALGPDVLLMGDTPQPGTKRGECAGQHNLLRKSKPVCEPISWKEIQTRQGPTEKLVVDVASNFENVEFHSIINNYCSAEGCDIFSNGEYLFRDANHIRRNISQEIKRDLILAFNLMEAVDWSSYKSEVAREIRTAR